MQTLVKAILTILFILVYSGCTPKVITKTVYVPAPKYDFQTVDFNNSKLAIKGIYYSSSSLKLGVIGYSGKTPIYQTFISAKDRLNICDAHMTEEKEFYRKIISFYKEQIKEYQRSSK